MAELLGDTYLWLWLSFGIFMVILWKAGKNKLCDMLDSRIETVSEELRVSENLRVEAQEMLAQYQRKHRNAVAESEKIVATAQKQADEIRDQALKSLEESIAQREKQLNERLNRMKQGAKDEIREYAASLAMAATKEIVASNLNQKTNEKLVKHSIDDVSKKFH